MAGPSVPYICGVDGNYLNYASNPGGEVYFETLDDLRLPCDDGSQEDLMITEAVSHRGVIQWIYCVNTYSRDSTTGEDYTLNSEYDPTVTATDKTVTITVKCPGENIDMYGRVILVGALLANDLPVKLKCTLDVTPSKASFSRANYAWVCPGDQWHCCDWQPNYVWVCHEWDDEGNCTMGTWEPDGTSYCDMYCCDEDMQCEDTGDTVNMSACDPPGTYISGILMGDLEPYTPGVDCESQQQKEKTDTPTYGGPCPTLFGIEVYYNPTRFGGYGDCTGAGWYDWDSCSDGVAKLTFSTEHVKMPTYPTA